jgi:tetratricopeptide (TPR) repeat protein
MKQRVPGTLNPRRVAGHSHRTLTILTSILLLLLLPPAALTAQSDNTSSSEGQAPEQSADTAQSSPSYEEVLDSLLSLPDDAELAARLQEAYTSLSDPRDAARLLNRFLPLLENGNRYSALMSLARFEEALGRLEKAQLHFQAAAFAAEGENRYRAMLNSAELLVQQGAYHQAELQLRRILDTNGAQPFHERARIVLAETMVLDENPSAARTLLSPYTEASAGSLPDSPQPLYQIYLLARELDISDLQTAAEEKLLSAYPAAPETALLKGEARQYPDIHSALGLFAAPADHDTDTAEAESTPPAPDLTSEDTETVQREEAEAIQAGSFRDGENAESLRRELEEEGFSATVRTALVQGNSYHRVLVHIASDETTDEVILRLKEAGYEGYPVYGE